MFPKSKNDDWGGEEELHVIGQVPVTTTTKHENIDDEDMCRKDIILKIKWTSGRGRKIQSSSCLSRRCYVWKKFCCYPPCLREAVLTEGVLSHPFEVVHIEQIGPPAYFFICHMVNWHELVWFTMDLGFNICNHQVSLHALTPYSIVDD